MNELATFFQQQGREEGFVKQQQFDITGEKQVYFVAQGHVDLFFVKEHADHLTGSLKHFMRVEEGQLFYGFEPLTDLAEWHIVVKPSLATKLITMKLADFEKTCEAFEDEAHQNVLVPAIDEWFKSITTAIIDTPRPVEYASLHVGEENAHPTGTILSVDKGILWVKVVAGQCQYLNHAENLIDANTPIVPVGKTSWLEVIEDTKLQCVTTMELAEQHRLCKAISQTHSFIFHLAIMRIIRAKQHDQSLTLQRFHNSETTFSSAISSMGRFFAKEKISLAALSDSEPALAVVQLIGQKQRLSVAEVTDFQPYMDNQAKIAHILHKSHLMQRRIAFRGDWWKSNHGHLITFKQEEKTPVALIAGRNGSYQLYDPTDKSLIKVDRDIANSVEPFGISLTRSLPEKKLSLKGMLQWALQDYWWNVLIIFIMAAFGGLLSLAVPMVTGEIFSTVIPEASFDLLIQLVLALLAASFGLTAFELTRNFTLQLVKGHFTNNVDTATWERLIKLPVNFFNQYAAGDLTMRAMGFNAIIQSLLGISADSLLDSIYGLFYFGILFYYSTLLGFVALGILAIIFIVTITLFIINVKLERKTAELHGELSGKLGEYVRGITKIRTTASESRVFGNWSDLFVRFNQRNIQTRYLVNTVSTLNAVFLTLPSVAIFALVAYLINQNELSLGHFLAFNSAFGSLLGIVMASTGTVANILHLIPTYERAKPILEAEPEVSEAKVDPGVLSGHIELGHINFRYREAGPLILKDVSLEILPGQFVAIVGPSGSGKSTVLRLLLQFETTEEGSVFYDSKPLNELDISLVRRQIGVVLQNSQLLPGSVFENIVGSSFLTIDDAWHAARQAGLAKDIEEMPMGMHTIISEGSGGLSGGQAQRLLIARALAHKPRILFFDEATSALDNETQAVVSKSLDQLNSTRVVIAHRLSTIINADKIIVLQDGVVMETGTYNQLMAKKELFYNMAQRQLA